jgi:hypothetical protein
MAIYYDPWGESSRTLGSVAYRHKTITPSDTEDLAERPIALRINGAGDIVVRDETGEDVTYTVTAGEVLLIRVVRVLATGTTATGIVAWY